MHCWPFREDRRPKIDAKVRKSGFTHHDEIAVPWFSGRESEASRADYPKSMVLIEALRLFVVFPYVENDFFNFGEPGVLQSRFQQQGSDAFALKSERT